MRTALLLILLIVARVPALADVKLPAVISDHMVLQADKPVAIWGWADPDESVAISFGDEKVVTTTPAEGRWKVQLGKFSASAGAQTLIVKGRNTIEVRDVLVGEVWLASGQSNMEMQVKGKMHGSVDHADEETAAANFPQIRMFLHDAPYAIYDLPVPPAEPLADRPGHWRVCSPETAADFSAIGYFFARDLHQQLKGPVGVVLSAVGGTPIEAWTSLSAQQERPALRTMLEDWEKRLVHFDPEREQMAFLAAKEKWLKERSVAAKTGHLAPKAPAAFKNIGVMNPGGLFNGMIAPLAPYAVRGVIWYQGERNAAGPFTGLYGEQLKTMIEDWRKHWNDEFYFAWIQLPGFQKEQRLPSEPNGWGVAVREGMLHALSVPHTGMAISIDLGGVTAGHPTNKAEFAARLSRIVLHDVYRQSGTEWSGPIFQDARRENGKMVIEFAHGSGLKAASGELKGFAIAGRDQKFVWASTMIEGDRVFAWSDKIAEPAAARYGWAGNPTCNLVNAANLPASPFRTDDWP